VRRLLLIPLLALGLLAAGCGGGGGGGSGGSSGGSVPAGASVAPSSSALFASVNTDFSSKQWTQTVALFDKFPGAKQLLAEAEKQLQGISLADVGQALGPETDVVLLDYRNGGDNVVVITQPKDEAKLQALLAQGDQKPETATVQGWTVIAQSKLLLARFQTESKAGTLSDSDAFKQAMDRLPGEAAAKLYVGGDAVTKELDRALSKSGAPSGITGDFGSLDSIAAAAVAEENGLSLSGDVAANLKDRPQTYSPELPSELPAGALLYVSFANLDQLLKRALDEVDKAQPNFKKQLGLVEGVTGLSLEGDLLPILSQEGAVAVYPAQSGQKLPDIALLLKLSDEGKVRSLLDRLATLVGATGSATVTSTTVSGAPVKKFEYEGVTVLVGVFDGMLVVTNSESVITGLRSSGDKLADDPLYKEAADSAGLPDKVLGLVYANLHDGLPAAFSFAEQSGSTVPPEAKANTEPLQSTLVWASSDKSNFPFGGFLAIK
jgi:hypothetical protein